MNFQFVFDHDPQDPRTSLEILRCLQYVNSPNPIQSILQRFGPAPPTDSSMLFVAGSDNQPNAVICEASNSILILIGGSTSRVQIQRFCASIESGPLPNDPLASVGYCWAAAESIRVSSLLMGGYNGKHVYIAGHSLGGAVAQVLGANLQTRFTPVDVRVWSYGAPRTGGALFAQRLSTMSNTRVVIDGDVVPWLPPHIDEVPASAIVSSISFWRGCNQLVQGPECYQTDFQGRWNPTAVRPPANWGFTLDVVNYLVNAMVGAPNANHSIGQYFNFSQIAAGLVSGPVAVPAQPAEVPYMPRPRERQQIIEIGRAEIFADATSPTGQTRTYSPPPVVDPSSPRYHAARDGGAWVVKLGAYIVGAATGKKNAKHLARTWNRSARATLK